MIIINILLGLFHCPPIIIIINVTIMIMIMIVVVSIVEAAKGRSKKNHATMYKNASMMIKMLTDTIIVITRKAMNPSPQM